MILSPEIKTLLIAMSPLVELRGAIPIAITVYHLPIITAYMLAVIGNLVPLISIVLVGNPLAIWFSKLSPIFKTIIDFVFSKVRKKTEKLGMLGENLIVVTLTAIPIPFIGGWTGAISAVILGLPAKRAVLMVFLGTIISGIIVTALTLAGVKLF
ncbi:MAG: small multi-drug export protein [bacterium]